MKVIKNNPVSQFDSYVIHSTVQNVVLQAVYFSVVYYV